VRWRTVGILSLVGAAAAIYFWMREKGCSKLITGLVPLAAPGADGLA
jgi:hypothetical protein